MFMNPCSSFFSIRNAQIALELAITFTPQYGDVFIEVRKRFLVEFQAVRLRMIVSELFLRFAHSSAPFILSHLLASLEFTPIIQKCIFSDPNYGGCWFTVKQFPLSNAEGVIRRSILCVAYCVAQDADLYYQAMKCASLRKNSCEDHSYLLEGIPFARCAFAIPPLFIPRRGHSVSIGEQLKLLFGSSQIEG